MTSKLPKLSDGVIVLGRFTTGDIGAVLTGEDDEHARRFGWYSKRSTRESVEDTIRRWNSDWELHGPTRAFAARLAGSGVLAGGCELHLRNENLAEMSYWVFPAHRRKGFGTRIAKLATTCAFEQLGVQRISVFVEPDNVGSLSVARKAGFYEIGKTSKSIGAGTPQIDVIKLELSAPGES